MSADEARAFREMSNSEYADLLNGRMTLEQWRAKLPEPRRVVILDVETGAWLPGSSSISGADGARLAASVLPGMPEELIAAAYADWLCADTGDRIAEPPRNGDVRLTGSLPGDTDPGTPPEPPVCPAGGIVGPGGLQITFSPATDLTAVAEAAALRISRLNVLRGNPRGI